MGSNEPVPFNYDYSIEFDDVYDHNDTDDIIALNNLLDSMPENIDKNDLKQQILNICATLGNILQIENGIHRIAQILTYNGYNIRIELDNTDWKMQEGMYSNISPIFTNNVELHYQPTNRLITTPITL